VSRAPGSAFFARIYAVEAGGERLLAMEGMRGVAVLLVFCVHYHALFQRYLADASAAMRVSRYVGTVGHAGVDLFFVLSGFLIYGATIRRAAPFARFMRRRVQRIYPTFLAVLSLYLLLTVLFPAQSKIPRAVVPAAGYLVANVLLLPGLFTIEPIITVAWSLSYEFFYYLALPLLVAALGMRGWRRGSRAAFFLVLFAFVVASPPWIGGARSRMGMFIPGILLYEAIESGAAVRWVGRWGERIALLLAVAGLATASMLRPTSGVRLDLDLGFLHGAGLRLVLLGPSFFLLTLYAFAHAGPLRRAMEWRPLRYLGNMSYSYYLLHGVTLTAVGLVAMHLAPPAPGRTVVFLALLPVALIATFVCSTGLFLIVEKPYSLTPAPSRVPRPVPVPTAVAASVEVE
jgi:exopolysaccharide production protein ExoZ